MNGKNANEHITDFKLERYLLNELDAAEMEQIKRAAQSDESLRARLETLERSNREILEKYPSDWMGQRIREKLGVRTQAPAKTRRGWDFRVPRLVLVPVGVLAVAVLMIFALPSLLPSGDPTGYEITRFKGSDQQLRIHRQTAEGSEELKNGDAASEKDMILIQYQVNEETFGSILSVDGWGTISTHLPAEDKQAMQIKPAQLHTLEYAYELDDAPRWEILFFVTAPTPFQVDEVIQALKKSIFVKQPKEVAGVNEDILEALDLPNSCQVTTFTLLKDSHHEN
jgi:anti-sigma-K factor RskA